MVKGFKTYIKDKKKKPVVDKKIAPEEEVTAYEADNC